MSDGPMIVVVVPATPIAVVLVAVRAGRETQSSWHSTLMAMASFLPLKLPTPSKP
jgi:hypothetical protein